MSRDSRRPSYDRQSDLVRSNVIVDMKIACIVTICAILWSTILIGETAHSKGTSRSRDSHHESNSDNATLEFRTVSVQSEGSPIVRYHPPIRSAGTQKRNIKNVPPSKDSKSMKNPRVGLPAGKILSESGPLSIHLELFPSNANQHNHLQPYYASKFAHSIPARSRSTDHSLESTSSQSPSSMRSRISPKAQFNGRSKRNQPSSIVVKRSHVRRMRGLPAKMSHRRLNTRSLRTERSYEASVNQVEEMIPTNFAKFPEGYEKGAIRIEPMFQVVKKKSVMDTMLEMLRKMIDPSKRQPGPLIGPMHFPGVGDKVYIRLLEPVDSDHVVIRLVTHLPYPEIEASFKRELLSSLGSAEIPEMAFSVNHQVAFPHSVDTASSSSSHHWIQSSSIPVTTFHPPVHIHKKFPHFSENIANHTGVVYGKYPEVIHGEASKKIEVQAKQDLNAPQEYRYIKDVKNGEEIRNDQRGGLFAKENESATSKLLTEKKGEEHNEQFHPSSAFRDSFHPYYSHHGKPQEEGKDRNAAHSSNSESSSFKPRSNRMIPSKTQSIKSYPEEDGAFRVITPPRIVSISPDKYSKQTSDWFDSQRMNYNVTKRFSDIPVFNGSLSKSYSSNPIPFFERSTNTSNNGSNYNRTLAGSVKGSPLVERSTMKTSTTESWYRIESNLTMQLKALNRSQSVEKEAQNKTRGNENRKAISTSTVKPIPASSTSKSVVSKGIKGSSHNSTSMSRQNSTNFLLQRLNCSSTNGSSSYEADESDYEGEEYYEDYYEDEPAANNSTVKPFETTTATILKPASRNLTAVRTVKSKIVMKPKLRFAKLNSTASRLLPKKRYT
ncbi:hypothetical protein KM043_018648 [Ampulex compressa]|nr:hypothetical protein KM043_018648 [Ampulex compressa]